MKLAGNFLNKAQGKSLSSTSEPQSRKSEWTRNKAKHQIPPRAQTAPNRSQGARHWGLTSGPGYTGLASCRLTALSQNVFTTGSLGQPAFRGPAGQSLRCGEDGIANPRSKDHSCILRPESLVSYCKTMAPPILTFFLTGQVTICHNHVSAHRGKSWAGSHVPLYLLAVNDLGVKLNISKNFRGRKWFSDCPERHPGELWESEKKQRT